MPTKLCKWGNSLGVRLPQYIAERTGLVAGDALYINLLDSGEIVIRPVKVNEVATGYVVKEQTLERVRTKAETQASW